MEAFRKRKGEAEKLARERGEEAGKILPTPEEMVAIVAALKEAVDQATIYARPIVWDFRDTGISPEELGAERFEKLVTLAQHQSAEVAQDVEKALQRGCPIDASYWLSMGMQVLREGLGDRATPGYEHLYQRVYEAVGPEHFSADNPAARELDRILVLDRKRHLGCGMG